MNSLDFIKQHVTEWPVGEYHTVFLYGPALAHQFIQTGA